MSADLPTWIPKALSSPRFGRYLSAAGGDVDDALRLYQWNIDVSSAFYSPLHWLEVGLRNGLHDRLRGRYGRADWWAEAPLDANGTRAVKRAEGKLARRKEAKAGPDDLVTELSFGFWVSLLSRGKAYDRLFWVPVLHRAFPHYSGSRQALHADLNRMLNLRNRIMHHEPIFHLALPAHRQTIYDLLGYLSPAVADLAARLDRVGAVIGEPPAPAVS
jgi:hypothetical protein